MLKRPNGPVAMIASSRVSMPYANGVFSKEMLEAMFAGGNKTLGAMILQAKRVLVTPKPGDVGRTTIEGMAKFLYESDDKKRELEREEHLSLYNLLGDPTMRVPMPQKATVTATIEGDLVRFSGTSPIAGKATIELLVPRTPHRKKRTGDTEEDFAKTYANANNRNLARITLTLGKAGAFGATIPRLKQIEGTLVARVFIEGKADAAAASTRITIPQAIK